MNCEFNSMQIAQEKLSVTRDMQRAAKDYQNSLDATKLIWQSDDGFIYDLSFPTMMTPSNLNSYNCNIVTDQQGRAVLSEGMFNAAVEAGMINENGDPVGGQKSNPAYDHNGKQIIDSNGKPINSYGADDNFTTYQYALFLEKLGQKAEAPASIIDSIKNIYNSKLGVGGTLPDNTMATALTTGAFLNYLSHPAEATVMNLPVNSSLDFDIIGSNGSSVYKAGTNNTSSLNYYILNLKAGDKMPQAIKNQKVLAGTVNNTGKDIYDINGNKWENGTALTNATTVNLAKGDITPIDIRVAIQTSKAEGSTIKLTDKTNPFPAFGNLTDLVAGSTTQTEFDKLFEDNIGSSNGFTGYCDKTAIGQYKGTYAISNKTVIVGKSSLKNLTLADLLQGNYLLTYDFGSMDEADEKKAIEAIVEKLIDTIAKSFGYEDAQTPSGKGLSVDTAANFALEQALEFTKDQFDDFETFGNNKLSDGRASEYNLICHDGDETYSVSISNIAKSFLTYFANNLGGFTTGFVVNNKVEDSIYSLDDMNYYYMIADDAQANDTDYLNAGFYNQLYNYICMYGACTDKNKQEFVMDNKYLSNALKNGQLFIASLNTDGYFYQGHYTANGFVAEVSDEDAIAKAEIEYEMTKTKLDYKEQTLELKMKNLDTEISALTTELDTVKGLIGKNVEKVFTMFST